MSATKRTPARRARCRRTGHDERDCRNILAALLGLEGLSYTDEISASRTILRCEHADATAVADFIDVVEQVDNVEPYRHGLASGNSVCVNDQSQAAKLASTEGLSSRPVRKRVDIFISIGVQSGQRGS